MRRADTHIVNAQRSTVEDLTLETGLLRLAYQPVIDLETGRMSGFEALLRCERAFGEPIAPGPFVQIAEETGLIVPIGGWILREACARAACWARQYNSASDLFVSVNVSACQLASRDLVRTVHTALGGSGLEPSRLVLEITETAPLVDRRVAARRLREVRAFGVHVALDDFGTGHSSLAYLRELPVDILKIDRSFVATITEHGEFPPIVRGMLELGHVLQLEVIAEGVELPCQRDRLCDAHCDFAQGYLFAPPLDQAAAEALLAARERDAGPCRRPHIGAAPRAVRSAPRR
jgi:EAL domain-containing protein (putative c-di-GMP-specific phosphodiesterase class I)